MRSGHDPCEIARRWLVSDELAAKLSAAMRQWERETNLTIEVISGYRTDAAQSALTRAGRPTALSNDLSTHRTCPATGADIRIGGSPLFHVTPLMKARWGRIAVETGLRWGGGSSIDPTTGIPSDWNHVDLGPRRDAVAEAYRSQL